MHQVFKKIVFFLALLIPFLGDQLLKELVSRKGSFLFFTHYVCNQGAAFSWSLPLILIIFLDFFIIVLLVWVLTRGGWNFGEKTLLLVLLGASLSNLGDRLFRGCVIDYIDVGFWPVFNLADAFLTVALGGLIFFQFRKGD